MPITRKQLSAAASTSNPPLRSSSTGSLKPQHAPSTNTRNLPVSDDDLFEQSAIQVSSASRQTRTINHQIPKEIRKQLHGEFAAAAKSLENLKDSGNKIAGRTLVKRSVSLSASKRTESQKEEINETTVVNDSIFDVPVSSPSPIRVADKLTSAVKSTSGINSAVKNSTNVDSVTNSNRTNVKSNPVTTYTTTANPHSITTPTANSFNFNAQVHTPVKTANPKIVILTTPSRPIIAGMRRTPLTFAEKRRRQNDELLMEDKPSRTGKNESGKQHEVEVDPFEIIDILGSDEPAVKNKPNSEVSKSEVSVNMHKSEVSVNMHTTETSVNKHKSEISVNKHNNQISVNKHNNQISVNKHNENCDATVMMEEDSLCVDLTEKENIETEVEQKPQLSSTTKKKRRIFIRNQASESAPPVITESVNVSVRRETESVKSKFEFDSEVVTTKPQTKPQTETQTETEPLELSLVIEVPPPPKLEDLETLDPELYVKLKLGSLKDDPSIPFISETDRVDIENFLESFASPELAKTMLPVAIIGEGTFSTVYKVIDKTFYECENSTWLEYSRQNPLDWLRLWRWVYESEASTSKFVLYRDGKRCVDRHGRSANERKSSNGRLALLLKRYLMEWAMRGLDSLLPNSDPSESVLSTITPRVLQSAMLRFRPYFIALKRINATSSPQRILDEITFLKHLGGKSNVVPMISGLRGEDQVLVTFPYFYSEEFREFLSSASLSINSIACYMRSLFISLAHLHSHNVIHRDVKPSNFLYAPENGGRAVLLDFGLAQKVSSSSNMTHSSHQRSSTGHRLSGAGTLAHQHRIHNSRNGEKERKKVQAVNIILNTLGSNGLTGDDPCEKMTQLTLQLGPGYFNNDPRAGMKASRAGTRGFRAPEVLFKCPNQTTALDIWSAGVILLTLLTRRYPFFQSSDDFDAIVEIANIFGNEEMSTAAKIYNRRWQCNVPSVPEKHVTWPALCQKLNAAFAPEIPPECFEMLRECLHLNSEKRITAKAALKHEFILKYAK